MSERNPEADTSLRDWVFAAQGRDLAIDPGDAVEEDSASLARAAALPEAGASSPISS